jgi:MbtH protein
VTLHAKPLFPSYIFAKFIANDLYQKVRYTRGIRRLISFGDSPTVVDEEIIAMIQSRISKDGFVRIDEDIKPGDKVVIKDGPFRTFTGVFEREMSSTDRVRVLLLAVSYQAHIEIERDMVKKIWVINVLLLAQHNFSSEPWAYISKGGINAMSWNDPDREDTTIYKVVVNHEEQYSIWPEYKENPLGWRDVGKAGPKAECLAFIKDVWTDMRPLSLRKKMEELA